MSARRTLLAMTITGAFVTTLVAGSLPTPLASKIPPPRSTVDAPNLGPTGPATVLPVSRDLPKADAAVAAGAPVNQRRLVAQRAARVGQRAVAQRTGVAPSGRPGGVCSGCTKSDDGATVGTGNAGSPPSPAPAGSCARCGGVKPSD